MNQQSRINTTLESPDGREDQKLLSAPWNQNQPLVMISSVENSLLKVSSAPVSPASNMPFFYGPKSPSNSSTREK